MSRSFPIIVSGPSGVGKSSIVERLLASDDGLRLAVSVTTRAPRVGEREAHDYYFVDRDTFERRQRQGTFVETAVVHGQLYGTPRTELDDWMERGVDVLLDLDYQGGLAVHKAYADAVSIFILPPSLEKLEARLRGRNSDDEKTIARRLEVASREMEHAVHYDFTVINHELDEALASVQAIIAGERQRVSRMDDGALLSIARPAAQR